MGRLLWCKTFLELEFSLQEILKNLVRYIIIIIITIIIIILGIS